MGSSPLGRIMEMTERFHRIYHTAGWAKNSGVLSGSGSTVNACSSLAKWISESGSSKVLDLGCGDLEWMATIEAITTQTISYYGIDIIATLVAHHKRVFTWFDGEVSDIESLPDDRGADLVLLKDVLFHLSDDEAEAILRKISSWTTWQLLAVTTHSGAKATRGAPQGIYMAPLDVEAFAERLALSIGSPVARLPRPDGGEIIIFRRSCGNMREGNALSFSGV